MVKAQRRLAQELKGVDAVLEVRDARLPLTSANPELGSLLGERARMILFNKAGLADPDASEGWRRYFDEHDLPHLFIDAGSGDGLRALFPELKRATTPLVERFQRRGIRPPLPRLMVVGFPNVGKTTLINRLVGKRRLATAPHPGVTRAVTWVTLKGRYELMDSPGVMLPRLDDEQDILQLGWIGTLPDHLVGEERLASGLLQRLAQTAPKGLHDRYGISDDALNDPHELLHQIGRRRGILQDGEEVDIRQVAVAVLQDFRAGRLGRVTLEHAPR